VKEDNMNEDIRATLAAQTTRDRLSALSEVVADFEKLADAYTSSEDLKSCRFHFHSQPMSVDLGKLDFFEDLSDDEKLYIRRAGSSLRFKFFVEEQGQLKSISESVRKQLQKLSVGNSSYIEKEIFYGEFLPFLKGKEAELKKLKAQMSDVYYFELEAFENDVLAVVTKVCPCRLEAAKKALAFISEKPVETFLNGISFDLETEYGKEGVQDQDLSELLEKSKRAYASRQVEAIFVGQLQELWNALTVYVAAIAKAPENLDGYSPSRKTLLKKVEKVERENIGGLPVISALTQSLRELSKEMVKDIANTLAFDIGAEIIGRGNDFGASFRFIGGLPEWFNKDDLLDSYAP
jgi:hypothetical protein